MSPNFIETKNVMTLNEGIALVEAKGYSYQGINDRYNHCYYLQFRSPEGITTLLSKWDIENDNF